MFLPQMRLGIDQLHLALELGVCGGGPRLVGLATGAPVEFVRGQGAWLWDSEGREHLDFFAVVVPAPAGQLPAKSNAAEEQHRRAGRDENVVEAGDEAELLLVGGGGRALPLGKGAKRVGGSAWESNPARPRNAGSDRF